MSISHATTSDQTPADGILLAVLHSQPPGAGTTTKRRVEDVSVLLGCSSSHLVNLYPAPLANSRQIPASSDETVWAQGREQITAGLALANVRLVLLGFGTSLPTGAARELYQEQLKWLQTALKAAAHPVVTIGDAPHHPSRWQRLTARAFPHQPYTAAAAARLTTFHTATTPAARSIR